MRVLAEAARELLRPSFFGVLAGYALVVGGFSLAAGEDHFFLWYVPFQIAPLLMAPLAARFVTRDRESGMASVLATTPLRRSEWLAAKGIALIAFVTAATTVAMLIAAVALSYSGREPVLLNLDRFGHAALVAFASAGAGLFIGVAAAHRGSAGTAAGFVFVLAAIGLGEAATELVTGASTQLGARLAFNFSHLSPLAWFYDALGPPPLYLVRLDAASPPAGVALVIVGAFFSGAAFLWSSRFSSPDGRPNASPLAQTGVVLAVALVALLIPSAWNFETSRPGEGDSVTTSGGELTFDFDGITSPGRSLGRIEDGDSVELLITVTARDERTSVSVLGATISAREMAFEPLGSPPYVLAFGSSPGAFSVAKMIIPFKARVGYASALTPVEVNLFLADEVMTLKGTILGRSHGVPIAGVVAAAAALSGGLFLVGRTLSDRANRW